jgi:GTPase SAR1 family protein
MKLMFVGNGNVGKTSLVKAFRTTKKERERISKLDPVQIRKESTPNVATDGTLLDSLSVYFSSFFFFFFCHSHSLPLSVCVDDCVCVCVCVCVCARRYRCAGMGTEAEGVLPDVGLCGAGSTAEFLDRSVAVSLQIDDDDEMGLRRCTMRRINSS